jgi:hypothetical protein
VAGCAEVEKLRARAQQLEAVARLNAETIRSMQEAAREQEFDFTKRRPRQLLAAKGAYPQPPVRRQSRLLESITYVSSPPRKPTGFRRKS